MDTFDLKRFLVENKLTRNSILLKENINIDKQGNLIYSLEDADIDYSDSSEILLTWEIDEINPNLIRKFEWDDTEDTIHTYIDVDDLPTVTLTIMDDSFENSQAPTLKLDLSAMWHSGDNGKIQILKDNPELQQEVMQKMQKEVQATFRKVIHSILGEPYGLDEFKRK